MALDDAESAEVEEMRLNEGAMTYRLRLNEALFYRVLGEESGQQIENEEHLFKLMTELVYAKREYDRVAGALASVRSTGYGMVSPLMSELSLEKPEIVRQGNRFGVKLKASAPSLHLIRVDIQTEVSPSSVPKSNLKNWSSTCCANSKMSRTKSGKPISLASRSMSWCAKGFLASSP